MKLSVIVPTRDRPRSLDDLLSSLTLQTLSRELFEVIVIDNGSGDETYRVAERYLNRLKLCYSVEREPGLHVGRHAGMRAARSDLLVFCDDDIIADSTWLASVLEAFEDPEVGLVGGNNRPIFQQEPPDWLQAWWERPMRYGKALGYLSILDFGQGRFEIDPGFVWGCNFSVRRRVLEEAGGFHPDALPPEMLRWRGDGETHVSNWVRHAVCEAWFHSGASVGHKVPVERMTLEYFERRAYAQGVSDSFSDLRRRRGTTTGRPELFLRRGHMAFGYLTGLLLGLGDPAARALRRARRLTQAAWLKGYEFHQTEAVGDPMLMTWVLREDYY